MIDATNAQAQITQLAGQLLPRCEGKQLILVYNKADLVDNIQNSIPDNFPDNGYRNAVFDGVTYVE